MRVESLEQGRVAVFAFQLGAGPKYQFDPFLFVHLFEQNGEYSILSEVKFILTQPPGVGTAQIPEALRLTAMGGRGEMDREIAFSV